MFQVIDENYLKMKNYATVQVWNTALSSLAGAPEHLHYPAAS